MAHRYHPATAEGISVNVTLIFALAPEPRRHDAYPRPGQPRPPAGTLPQSAFCRLLLRSSRWTPRSDTRLDQIATSQAPSSKGKAAIATPAWPQAL